MTEQPGAHRQDPGPATPAAPTPEDGTAAAPAAPTQPPAARTPGKDPLRGSRTSGVWAGVVAFGVLLLLLIIFIAQNTQSVSVAFLGWDGEAPLAVTLLIAATAGLFLTIAAGSLRILQLRRRVRREAKIR